MAADLGKGMTRREFISRGAGSVAGATLLGKLGKAALAAGTKPARRPNVVFVFADQMRAASLGCMGSRDAKTPNMDKMAKGGLLFTNAISGYPLCSPYRATLLTGRYPNANGVIGNAIELPAEEITIAQVLKAKGYKTGFIGKWHLEKNQNPFVPKERRHGFDYWASRNLGGDQFDSFYCADTEKEIPLPGYEADAQTDLAIDFMRKNAKEPFCLFLAWRPPHPPLGAPKKYESLYDPAKFTLRPNVRNREVREDLVKYCGMISALDANIARLIRALDDLGLAEDTIFCFSSDHGDMFGSQGLMGKNVPWEESIHIPFIMRYPRQIKPGGKTDVLINSVDVMPTLLGLCGVPIPKAVQGTDLSPVILGKGGRKPEAALLQRIMDGGAIGEWRGVRTARYTYARTRDKGWLLYDNIKDPYQYQMNNLIDKPEAKPIQDKLDAQLQEMLKKAGDDFAPAAEWRKRVQDHLGRRWQRLDDHPGGRRRRKPVGDPDAE